MGPDRGDDVMQWLPLAFISVMRIINIIGQPAYMSGECNSIDSRIIQIKRFVNSGISAPSM